MKRKIVFPDAPSSWELFFDEERLSRLNSIGEFTLGFCDDFPEPDNPVNTISLSRGRLISIFLRLCVRAPLIVMNSIICLNIPENRAG